jgi:hypothetical protein
METMVVESLLALGLCLAAVLSLAVYDLCEAADRRRQQRQSTRPPARPSGSAVRFGGLLRQLAPRAGAR